MSTPDYQSFILFSDLISDDELPIRISNFPGSSTQLPLPEEHRRQLARWINLTKEYPSQSISIFHTWISY